MNRILLTLAGLALCAAPLCAQIVTYEPGNGPSPADLIAPGTHQSAGAPPVPIVGVEMDPTNRAPRLQRAHSGLYQDLSGRGYQLDYRHLSNGSAIVKVLAPDGTWGEGFGLVTGSQVLLPLYADGEQVGEVKIGATNLGGRCARLNARARFGTVLLFPIDTNHACSPAPGVAGSTLCRVQTFGDKLSEAGAGPETCQP